MNKDFLKAVDKLNTVIIPGLGAVIKMGKKYSFNTFLNYDDGRFVKYIQEETNITLEEAETKVNSWYSDIKSSIDTSGSFKLPGIGEIKKSQEGKLDFSLDLSSSKTSSSEINTDTKKQEKAEIQEQEEIKKQVEQESQILDTIKKKEKEDEKEKGEERKDNIEDISVPQFKLSDDEPDPVIEALIQGAEKIENENKRSKLSRILIFSGLILFLVGGSLVGYLKYDSIISYIKADDIQLITKTEEAEIENDIVESIDILKKESINVEDAEINETINDNNIPKNNETANINEITQENEVETNVEEQKIKEETLLDKSNTNKKYHPVVGTFGEIDNANRLVKELISKGFTGASILKINNDLNCVKLGSFNSKIKARDILDDSKLDGWVKYY